MQMTSNPFAEHNAALTFSSTVVPGGGTGNLHPGPAGHALQGGGGGGTFYGYNAGNINPNDPSISYARGSYAPLQISHNANMMQNGGYTYPLLHTKSKPKPKSKSKSNKKSKSRSKSNGVIYGGARSRRKVNMKYYVKSRRMRKLLKKRNKSMKGGNYPNAAYSVAGTTLHPNDSALANPAPIQAYNSCHPL